MNRSNLARSGRSIGGADFLQLDPSEAVPGGLADWLTERLRTAISTGHLPVGARLPATRTLATDLGISRGVVTETYQRLTEDGHIAGQGRRGTVVVAAALRPTTAAQSAPATKRNEDQLLTSPGLDAFDRLRGFPAKIDLTPGVPDLAAFPRAAWMRAERAVLSDLQSSDFGYGDPAGTPALRRAVAIQISTFNGELQPHLSFGRFAFTI